MADTGCLANLLEQTSRPRLWQIAQVDAQHLAVQKVERVTGFLETGERQTAAREMIEELPDLRHTQFARMPFAVKENELAHMVGKALGRGRQRKKSTRGLPQLIEQSR